jgi:hypothetical protein
MYYEKNCETINLIKNTLKNKNPNISLDFTKDLINLDQLFAYEFNLIFYDKKKYYKILKLTIISYDNGIKIISKHAKLLFKINDSSDNQFTLINKFIDKLTYHCLIIYNMYKNIKKYYKIQLQLKSRKCKNNQKNWNLDMYDFC